MATKANVFNLYWEALMSLTLSKTGIALIFWEKSFLVSNALSIKVTPQSVSRYTKALESSVTSSIIGSNVMVVEAYVHLLNARPKFEADNFAAEWKIGLAKTRSMPISAEVIQANIQQPDFI